MRRFSGKTLAAAAVAAVGTVGVGAGLAGAADSRSGDGGSSEVQLVQTDPSTTVPDQAPEDDGDRDRHCDHDRDGSGGEGSSGDRSGRSAQASFRRGDATSLRGG
jgi:hypothetical protein